MMIMLILDDSLMILDYFLPKMIIMMILDYYDDS